MHGWRTRSRRYSSIVAGSLAVGLVLAACGSDGDSGNNSDPTTGGSNSASSSESTGPKPTKSIIKIGVETSITGTTASSYFGVVPTAKAWAKWVNETQGGVGGHPVEIVVKDTKGDAGATLAAMNELIADKSVVASLVADSQAEGVVAEPTEKAGMPVIGGSSTDAKAQGKRTNYFTTGTMTPYYLEGLLLAAKANGAKKVGSVVCAESPACGEISKLFNSVSEPLGLGFAGSIAVAAASPNFTAPCLSLIGAGADFATLVLAGAVLQRVAKDCNAQGYKGSFGAAGQSVLPTQFDGISGLKMAGTIQGFPWWSEAAPVKNYVNIMNKYMSKSEVERT
jgi:branched-chain amino acid transport system substrate-binding protein